MPGSITHYLFAKDCLFRLDNTKIKNIINNNIDIFILGCHGPNFFSYSNYLPFLNNKNLSEFSDLIHNRNINYFFENMISYSNNTSCIRSVFNNDNFSDITMAYIYGFLSHYVLDTFTHPYIYNLQLSLKNQYKKKSPKSLHKSIETHIDILLLKKMKNLNPNEFDDYKNTTLNPDELLILCDMYTFLLKKVFNKSILYSDIVKCFKIFRKNEKILNSSNNFYTAPYSSMKKIISKTSYIDNKIYSNHIYCINDLLNDCNSIWENPYSHTKSSSSFMDIYFSGIDFYLELVDILSLYINNKKTMLELLSKINDKSFFTNEDWRLNYKNL